MGLIDFGSTRTNMPRKETSHELVLVTYIVIESFDSI